MNSINNNISNSNYNNLSNNNQNTKKEEESIFDKTIDSIKEFFGIDDEESSENVRATNSSNPNLDRAYLNSYTLAPIKNEETLGEKWEKDNENAALKVKEREIANLKQKVNTLQSKNKLLVKQNEKMMAYTQAQSTPTQNEVEMTNNTEEVNAQKDKPKVYSSLPTHTSIPDDILEKQKEDIAEVASSTKVEAPSKTIKEDDTSASSPDTEVKA